MKTWHVVVVLVIFLILLGGGCDQDKVAQVEKQKAQLQGELNKERSRGEEFDLQQKCAKDAKGWFDENWASGADKDTVLLTYTNHYNKNMNKLCVI